LATLIQLNDIANYIGQDVTVRGWVYNRTDKGRLQFILVRDGYGMAQCVAFRKEMDEQEFEIASKLAQESSVIVTGTVRADERAPGIPGGFEIGIKNLQLVQQAEDYPITPKEHGTEFLMDNRHLWVRSTRQWAILRIRATIVSAMRNWLDEHGYLLVDTPIITPAAGEETTTLFGIDYFGEPAFLAQTGQLYNEANIGSFGKVYCFGPTFRAENSKTRRHLNARTGDGVLHAGRPDGDGRAVRQRGHPACAGEAPQGTGNPRTRHILTGARASAFPTHQL
jgi:asparaginyl-tRNA synthetase